MSEERNPFHWRGTVTAPEAFVGREREFTRILARLRTLGGISVVGKRGIGKSSLLYQASVRAGERLGPDCRTVYIDMLSAAHHDLDGLLKAILAGIGAETTFAVEDSPAEKLAAFDAAIRKVRGRGCLPVAFVDEFEHLASRKQQFGNSLVESWRSLGNDDQMGFVTSSESPLEEVTQECGLACRFHSIFVSMELKEFTQEETQAFADRAVRVGGFEAADKAFLLKVGGQHPLRLQVAAWHLFEARNAGQVDFGLLEDEAQAEIAGMIGAEKGPPAGPRAR